MNVIYKMIPDINELCQLVNYSWYFTLELLYFTLFEYLTTCLISDSYTIINKHTPVHSNNQGIFRIHVPTSTALPINCYMGLVSGKKKLIGFIEYRLYIHVGTKYSRMIMKGIFKIDFLHFDRIRAKISNAPTKYSHVSGHQIFNFVFWRWPTIFETFCSKDRYIFVW